MITRAARWETCGTWPFAGKATPPGLPGSNTPRGMQNHIPVDQLARINPNHIDLLHELDETTLVAAATR